MLYIRFVGFCLLLFFFAPRALSYSSLQSNTLVTRLNLLLEHSFCICFTRLWGTFDQDSAC